LGTVPWEIVGIVEDTRQFLDAPAISQVFFDYRQLPRNPAGGAVGGFGGLGQRRPPFTPYYVVRADGDVTALLSTLRGVVRQLNPEATLDNVATMEQRLSNSVARPRLLAVLLGIFAVVAVVLAAIGIYGVIAYSITRRTREIGIRIALGARRRAVLALVLRQGLILAAIGITIGIAGASAVTRYLDKMLFGLSPLDPATFVAVSLGFAAVAAAAAFVPARRATKVDPLVALRCE
jgi:putative ABC transport system permease protein